MRRLRQLEDEHNRRKRLVADLTVARRADPNASASDVAETFFILSFSTAANTGTHAAKALAHEAFDRIKQSATRSELYPKIKEWLNEVMV